LLHQSKDEGEGNNADEVAEQEGQQEEENGGSAGQEQKGINRPEAVAARATYVPERGCPTCNPEIACAHYQMRGVECHSSGAHGGAGIIFSIGLMRRIQHYDMEE
jgi:hypothetical protein